MNKPMRYCDECVYYDNIVNEEAQKYHGRCMALPPVIINGESVRPLTEENDYSCIYFLDKYE